MFTRMKYLLKSTIFTFLSMAVHKKILCLLLLLSFVLPVVVAEAGDVWFLLDSSASLNQNQARLRNKSAIAFSKVVLSLSENDRLGVVDFSDRIRVLKPIVELDKIEAFINNIGYQGQLTDIGKALSVLEKRLDSKTQLYLFTDGSVDVAPSRAVGTPPGDADLASIENIKRQIETVFAKHKAKINVIGLGDYLDDEFLEFITDKTGGRYIRIKKISDLIDAFISVYAEKNSRSVINLNENGEFRYEKGGTGVVVILVPKETTLEGAEFGGVSQCTEEELGRKIITFTESAKSGKYRLKPYEKNKTEIITNPDLEIFADSFVSLGDPLFQYEVLPFEVTLHDKSVTSDLLSEELVSGKLNVTVICRGDYKVHHSLQYEKKVDSDYFLYLGAWWIDHCPAPDSRVSFRIFVDNQSNFDLLVRDLYGFTARVLPISMEFEIVERDIPAELKHLPLTEKGYFVGEAITAACQFQIPASSELIETKREYYLGTLNDNNASLRDYKKITFPYMFSEKDSKKNDLACLITCVNSTNNKKRIFLKRINIEVSPQSFLTPATGLKDEGQGFFLGTFYRFLSKRIVVPMDYAFPDDTKLHYSLKIDNADACDLGLERKSETVASGLGEVNVYLEVGSKMEVGQHQLNLRVTSPDFAEVLEYRLSFTVKPLWGLISAALVLLVFLVVFVRTVLFIVQKKNSGLYRDSRLAFSRIIPGIGPSEVYELPGQEGTKKIYKITRCLRSHHLVLQNLSAQLLSVKSTGNCKVGGGALPLDIPVKGKARIVINNNRQPFVIVIFIQETASIAQEMYAYK